MERLTGDIEQLGWRIRAGFAGAGGFYAVYAGDAFGRPERGVLAAMARAHPADGDGDGDGGAAAQIVVHELAEGYFSARPTLGPKRAVARVLAGINDWLVAQLRHGGGLATVSVSALLFHDTKLAVVRVGRCRIFRVRGGVVTPLLEDERIAAPAAVGREAELATEYAEETVEAGDRFVLLSGPPVTPLFQLGDPEDLARALAAGGAPAALVLDVLARPAAAAAPDLTALPLRPAPREGDVWDGFRIGRTLYRGRYTILKAAYDEVERRDVALKIPLPAMLQDEVFAAGFMREAWIGGAARGANLARYLDVPAERRRSLYLVMPLYDGETLEARLLRAPPVALPEGIGVILKICEAVRDLAALDVIHRDIKPENVMLTRGEVRLLDLGLAFLPGIDTPATARPGGTLRYMAPELIKGAPASARSEVFALGVTAYRMFAAGRFPFGQRERTPLARARPDLPAWLGAVLGRALAEAPERRFEDAGAFALALQQGLIAGEDDPAMARWRGEAWRLRFWQAAALGFAIGFFILLARALR